MFEHRFMRVPSSRAGWDGSSGPGAASPGDPAIVAWRSCPATEHCAIDDLSLGIPAFLSAIFLAVWGTYWAAAVLVSLVPPRRLGLIVVALFVNGWVLSELPLVNLLVLSLGTGLLCAAGALHFVQGLWGLGLSAAAGLGLLFHARQSLHVPALAEAALREGLGEHYADRLPDGFDHRAGFPPLRLYLFLLLYDRAVRVVRDIPYVEGGSARQRLDVYMPPGDVKDAPVIFQVHGGAWILGSKAQQARPLLYMLARQGFVCVSINYRLSPRVRWPSHLIDAKRALAWTKQHIAEFGGDPARVLVTGGSAGGQLASLLALTPNQPELQPGFEEVDTRVQAAVPFYGIYDFLDRHRLKPNRDLTRYLAWVVVRRSHASHPELFDSASPITHVRPDAPPMFIIHGTQDTLAPVEEARLFAQRLGQVSRSPVVYLELPYAHHMFETFYSLRTLFVLRAVHAFAALHLSNLAVSEPRFHESAITDGKDGRAGV